MISSLLFVSRAFCICLCHFRSAFCSYSPSPSIFSSFAACPFLSRILLYYHFSPFPLTLFALFSRSFIPFFFLTITRQHVVVCLLCTHTCVNSTSRVYVFASTTLLSCFILFLDLPMNVYQVCARMLFKSNKARRKPENCFIRTLFCYLIVITTGEAIAHLSHFLLLLLFFSRLLLCVYFFFFFFFSFFFLSFNTHTTYIGRNTYTP